MAARSGGAPILKVLLKGGEDMRRAILVSPDGPQLSPAVGEAVRQRSNGSTELDVRMEAAEPVAAILSELRTGAAAPPSPGAPRGTLLLDWEPDIVGLSLAADVLSAEDADDFFGNGAECIRLMKEHVGAHILLLNASSVNSADLAPNAQRADFQLTLKIHKLNQAAIQLSVLEGISLVDVDRMVAEVGADGNVLGTCHYSDALEVDIGNEVVRILDDYGYFEERPLVQQVGRKSD
jgi:hypothetical protein